MEPEQTTKQCSLNVKRTFSAPRDRVFAAWTDPDRIKNWHAPMEDFKIPFAEVDLRVGGKYRYEMRHPDGESYILVGNFQEVDAPKKLVYTFIWEEGNAGMGETLVTVHFHSTEEGGTEIDLTHERFPDAETMGHHDQGWNGCLDRLAKLV